ncbi:1-phosphatidylinositol-4-phosphate 5-kinase NDAI_0C04800 [Naumovozyma dairenensis CBS 421]|uniref:1-phosphatidylinositol-4-phosphate 5-kinase n=1 Tax=Naumovozyma dairenensis (strain ATCC 10597 / BCRC 20456 / CBS 421 / NBRC 0211 / NRRL Y-12639) TaxID=1071378 RepID=G0W8M8_NAUDC|nr:hypothetical protein NDAI_0C04800 [Naumovozyma dairenensis CBS 421]CCD24139.1 hypothetical protein NDAI_0C04800 [Naumovozyma dairenensis CBS 421]
MSKTSSKKYSYHDTHIHLQAPIEGSSSTTTTPLRRNHNHTHTHTHNNGNNHLISHHHSGSSNSDSNYEVDKDKDKDSPRLSDAASSTPTSLEEFHSINNKNNNNKIEKKSNLKPKNNTDSIDPLLLNFNFSINDDNNNKNNDDDQKVHAHIHHLNTFNNKSHSTTTTTNTVNPNNNKFDANDDDPIQGRLLLRDESLKKNYHPWKVITNTETDNDNSINNTSINTDDDNSKIILANNDYEKKIIPNYNIGTTLTTDSTNKRISNSLVLDDTNLIHTSSYIHDKQDDHILLNKIVSRKSSSTPKASTRRNTQDSIRTNIPFHASKHSQILPLDHFEIIPYENSNSNSTSNNNNNDMKRKRPTNHSMSSLPVPFHFKDNSISYSYPSKSTNANANDTTKNNDQNRTNFHSLSTVSLPPDIISVPNNNPIISNAQPYRPNIQQHHHHHHHHHSYKSKNKTNMNMGKPGDLKRSESATAEIKKMRESLLHKREMKRKRKTFLIDDDRVLIGNKVSEGHVNFIIAYNMLTGIRVAVSRCCGIMKPLTSADFKLTKKLAFDYHGNELTPSSQYAFKFKDYSPEVFRELRAKFGLDPADYLVSLTSKYILSELNSPGKSGSFFYYSRDYKYIIKTIHHSEHRHLRRHLEEYYNHVKNNPNTLICQFYGLHRVKMPISFQHKVNHRKIYFIVMNNLFPPHLDIHTTFDLKGSTWGRYTEVNHELMETDKFYRPVLKDLNWLELEKRINFGPVKKKMFLDQLKKDVTLLSKLNTMDYSLLLGIHDINKNQEFLIPESGSIFDEEHQQQPLQQQVQHQQQKQRMSVMVGTGGSNIPMNKTVVPHYFKQNEGGIISSNELNMDGKEIYYVGIIDCLTNYSIMKKLEAFWRSLNHDPKTVSAVPPKDYGDRFYKFIEKSVDTSPRKKYKDNPNVGKYKD